MATTTTAFAPASSSTPIRPTVIKIEDSPEPSPGRPLMSKAILPINFTPTTTSFISTTAAVPSESKDPEGFLKRCCGYNKKTKLRCSVAIGQKSYYARKSHPTYLPTCHAHRDQQSHAGWCQFRNQYGKKCGRLFRWNPPYLQLCTQHQGHADTPCYLFKLPLELRLEIFRYLLPTNPIGSSTSILHQLEQPENHYHSGSHPEPHFIEINSIDTPPHTRLHQYRLCGSSSGHACTYRSEFPMPLLDLYLVNHQFYREVKDLLFSVVPFRVDIRKDGTFMCGRRLLEPLRADGTSHYVVDEAEDAKDKFIKRFDWKAVKNYHVDILVENWVNGDPLSDTAPWDEEVEIYDIRDYVGVVVTGILAKSRSLCRLNVQLAVADFSWTEEELLANIQLLVGPFERLRNVRQPRFKGVFGGKPEHNYMMRVPRPAETTVRSTNGTSRTPTPLCSIPRLAVQSSIFLPGNPVFEPFRTAWEEQVSMTANFSVLPSPPIREMFMEFKDFYAQLTNLVPNVTLRHGRLSFLHRARVAREDEYVEAFRLLRNELIDYWYAYLDQEERKKNDLNEIFSRMLEADIYPEWQPKPYRKVATDGSSIQSPVSMDANAMIAPEVPIPVNTVMTENRAGSIQGQNLVQPYQTPSPTNTASNQIRPYVMTIQEDYDSWWARNAPEGVQYLPRSHYSPCIPPPTVQQHMTECDQPILSTESPQELSTPVVYPQYDAGNDMSAAYAPPPLTDDSPSSSQGSGWMSASSAFPPNEGAPYEQTWYTYDGNEEIPLQSIVEVDEYGIEIMDFDDSISSAMDMSNNNEYVGKGKGKMRVE